MLPGGNQAFVDRSKISDYLLCESHPDGRSKAVFFARVGFKLEQWERLSDALVAIATSNPVKRVVESAHGTRYIVDGPIKAPDGRTPVVHTIWIVEAQRPPRLVTAYPHLEKTP